MSLSGNHFVKGNCQFMCPTKERNLRSKEKMVHILETTMDLKSFRLAEKLSPDPNKMIKKFSRSAAGQALSSPELLRPPKILFKTVNYLLSEVILDSRIKFSSVVEFITDALRSVRQDAVIQEISAQEWVQLLQPMVRFHSYVSHRLAACPISEFDPHLNRNHLNECLKRLLYCYDELDEQVTDLEQDEFEALFLLLNPSHAEPLTRFLSLKRRGRLSVVAFNISIAWLLGRFSKITHLVRHRLTPILVCTFSLNLPSLRSQILDVLSAGYSSKNLWYPVTQLTQLLLCNDSAETISCCKYYGIECKNDLSAVRFEKCCFDREKPKMSSGTLNFLDEMLKSHPLPDILLGKVCFHEEND